MGFVLFFKQHCSIYYFSILFRLRIAIVGLIGLAICIILPSKFTHWATNASYELRQQSGYIANTIEENILSQSVVKVFGLEQRMSKKFSNHLDELKTAYVPAKFLAHLVQRIPNVIFTLIQIIVLSISGIMAYRNLLSVGTLISLQTLLLGLNSMLLNFAFSLPFLVEGAAGMQRVRELLEEIPQVSRQHKCDRSPSLIS